MLRAGPGRQGATSARGSRAGRLGAAGRALGRAFVPWALVALVALESGCGQGPDGQEPRLSAVLVTLDTTRADALGCYGGPPGLTPQLDRLAAESVRYTQARTVVPLTLPAHVSMLTGRYPPRTGVRDNAPAALAPEAVTLAERAAAEGYQTAAFVAASTLDRSFGLAQGFDAWTQPPQGSATSVAAPAERRADAVIADALAWLEGRDRERPFLLWVHLFDPHQPYDCDEVFLRRAGGSAYHGEVAQMDDALGRLLELLRAEGLLERTALAVVGDHGEGLGEHGEETHGYLAWDSTLRVPFLLRHPDGRRAGEASDETVSVVDVFPTLVEALALGAPGDVDGLSLWRGRVPDERHGYFEAMAGWARLGWSELCGSADGEGKYVHSSRPAFYRVREDPDELRDRLGELGAGVEPYRAMLREVLARPTLARRAAGPEAPLDDLARLGYAAGGGALVDWPDPLAASGRPSPHARAAELAGFLAAQAQARGGDPAGAVPRLEALVADNPLNLSALDELGQALIELADYERAADVLERRAALAPDRFTTHKNLLRCYMELGREQDALRAELRALELLIELAEQRGDPDEARRLRAIRASEARQGGR